MQCLSCAAENSEGRRFCGACGAGLPTPCPGCGFANAVDDKFCGGCGQALASMAVPIPPTSRPREAERRQVSVLFVDLCGFTALSSEMGPEEIHHLLSRFFTLVDGIVGDFGGTIDKHIGDAVMAVFGAPIAHSDDHERAVRAALEVHQKMAVLSVEFSRDLKTHNGVASGQVVASGLGSDQHQEYTVLGDSVNLAARLVDRAKAGETLISDEVARALIHRIKVEGVGRVTVKGLTDKVKIWRLLALNEHQLTADETHFVGRHEEIRRFEEVIADCTARGTGAAIYLRGDAGIGKSRLSEEFVTRAVAAGYAHHNGQALDFGAASGQDAIRDIVLSLFDLTAESDEAARIEAARQCLEDGQLQVGQLIYLHDLLGIKLELAMRTTYDAIDNATRNRGKLETVVALLRWHGQQQPLLIRVEDLHWAPSISIDYLVGITAAAADIPMVVLMTSRFEGDPLSEQWRSRIGTTELITMDLSPLAEADALELAGGYVDAINRFTLSCIKRAEGNPFFLEQLLHSAEDMDEDDVPGSVQSIVLARVDRLSELDRAAVQAAAALGQRFQSDVVRYLVDDENWTIDALIEHRLIREDGGEHWFVHALIWESVYGTLLREQRVKHHRKAALWYSNHDPVLRAEHLERAEDALAAAAFLDAANDQRRQFHFERSLKLTERGLHLVSDDGERHDLLILYGECQTELGNPRAAIPIFRDALAIAHTDLRRCRAWLGMVAAMRVIDEYDEGLRLLDEAELTARGDRRLMAELSQVHYLRGSLYFPLGDLDGCMAEHQKALETGRQAGSPEAEARALSGLGDAHYSKGRMISALDYYRRCIELCQVHGFGRLEFSNRYMVGWNRLYLNEVDGSAQESLAAAEASAQAGHGRGEMVARLATGRALYEAGTLDMAEGHLRRGLELAANLGAHRFDPFFEIYLTRVNLAQGATVDGLVERLEKMLEITRTTGFSFIGPWVLSTLALISPDAARGEAAINEGREALKGACIGHNYFEVHRDAMEFFLRRRELDEVEYHAVALETYTQEEPLPFSDYFIARGRALVAHYREANAVTKERLIECRAEAEKFGLRQAMPAINAALDGGA